MSETPEREIESSCAIDRDQIEQEYIELPGHIAYWSARYADAYEDWLFAKAELEQCDGMLQIDYKTRLGAECKKPTVADIESCVVSDPLHISTRAALVRTEAQKVRLGGVMEALRAKKDMLVSLGAHIRQEKEHDPSFRQRSALDRELAENQNRG